MLSYKMISYLQQTHLEKKYGVWFQSDLHLALLTIYTLQQSKSDKLFFSSDFN